MKREYLILSLAFFLSLLTGLSAYLLKGYLMGETGTLTIEYPSYAVADNKGGAAIIDRSMRRIVGLDNKGAVAYTIDGGSRKRGGFFYAYGLTLDEEGSLYVHNGVLDDPGFFMNREEIIKYDSRGKFIRVIFTRTYGEDEKKPVLVQRTRLSGLKSAGRMLSWYETDGAGIKYFRAYPDKGAVENPFTVKLDRADLLINSLDRDIHGALVYSTKKGEIVRCVNGDCGVIYNADAEPGLSTPWDIACGNDGIYFTDLGKLSVRMLKGKKAVTVLDTALLRKIDPEVPDSIFYRISLAGQTLAACNDYSVFLKNSDGIRIIENGAYPPLKSFIKITAWTALILSAVFLLFCMGYFYIVIKNRKSSLVVKQLVIFIPIIILSIFFIARGIILDYSERYQNELMGKISQAVQLVPLGIDHSLFTEISKHGDYLSPQYDRLRNSLLSALNYNRDQWNKSFYFVLYRVVDSKLYGMMYLNGGIGIYHPFQYFDEPESPYRKAWAGEIVAETESDSWGSWLYAVGPVKDESGRVTALIEIGTDLYSFRQQNDKLIYNTLKGTVAVAVVFIIAIILVTYFLLVSIRILSKGVMRLSEGEWDTKVMVRNRNDEVADLSAGFNRMSEYILNYINEITELNRVYRRFVPEQFIRYLGKEQVTQVKLGDQVQQEMTIMFTDIRSFTTLSEAMTPRENFDFLNSFLGTVGPVVRDCHGFIDKYIGDAIMALFPYSADDAMDASAGIFHRLNEFNSVRISAGLKPISIGLALHTGPLMLGILGEEERMEGTVISDNVNLASRLEGLTKHFGTSMIISSATREALKDSSRYIDRPLGRITVKGKSGYIEIYELLDVLPQRDKMMKIKTLDVFTRGVALYGEGKLAEAASRFEKILAVHPEDLASEIYLDLCKTVDAGSSDWKGTIIMKDK